MSTKGGFKTKRDGSGPVVGPVVRTRGLERVIRPEDHDPVVKTGLPDFQKHLTQGDERRIDDKGRPVVSGLPWSEARTGLYLTVMVTTVPASASPDNPRVFGIDRPGTGRAFETSDGKRRVGLFVTVGRPCFSVEAWGAALELPSDLAKDRLKVQYVTEWFIETLKEAVVQSATAGDDGAELLEGLKGLEGGMALAVDKMIGAMGL